MKIAIDTHFLSKISQGTGTYTYQLVDALQEYLDKTDLVYLLNKDNITDMFKNPQYKWGKLISNKTPINILYGFLKIMNEVDVIHTNYLCPLISSSKTKRVVTIHDILFKTHSQYFPKKLSWGVDLLTSLCLKRADKIISVSKYTRDMLVRYYPFTKGKCEVIYEAPSKDYFLLKDDFSQNLKEWHIFKPFILFVGRFAPMKNVEKLIEIYTLDAEINKNYDLVLVGKFDKSFPNKQLEGTLKSNGNIKVLHGISNQELNFLYNAATMLYFVSNGEGFGLPIIEAMAAGCPVLTSNTTACKEIAANAAYMVDPDSIDEIHSKIKIMLGDSGILSDLRFKGMEHVKHFSWNKCAKETYEIYQGFNKDL